jgi:ComEC/Rec2-related protein
MGGWVVWILSAALAAGILQRTSLLAAAFLLLAWIAIRTGVGRRVSLGTALLCAVLYLYGSADSRAYVSRCNHIDSLAVAATGPMPFAGVVVGYPVWKPGSTQFELQTRVGGMDHRLLVRAKTFAVEYGDSLELHARIDPPGRTRRTAYLRGRGVTGSVRTKEPLKRLTAQGGDPITRLILWPAHKRLRVAMTRGLGAESGVPVALLLGERGYLESRVSRAFSTLGISHLLALSGFHLGFITMALLTLMKAMRVRNRLIVIACLTLYVGIVGFVLSLYRALVMVTFLMLAARLRRPLSPVTALGNALVIMLRFQLSFLATFAVLLCVARMAPPRRMTRMRKTLYGMGSTRWVSAVVQVWVAPILLASFGGFSLVAPLATLLFSVPVIVLLSTTGVTAAVALLAPGPAAPLFTILGWMTDLFGEALALSVSWSPAMAKTPMPNLILFYGGMWLATHVSKRLWITFAGTGVVLLSCAAPFFSRYF